MREGNAAELVMLDVQMPVLDGFNSALSMRAIERGYGHPRPTPLIFFSSQPCNERARWVVEACRPAIYINKEASPDLTGLVDRVEQVMHRMLIEIP